MSSKLNRIHLQTLSLGLAIVVPATQVLSSAGCSTVASTDDGAPAFRVLSDMLLSETSIAEVGPESPLTAGAALIAVFSQYTAQYAADGVATSNPNALLSASKATFSGLGGVPIKVKRSGNRLQIVGAEVGVGVEWSAAFDLLSFHTPDGRVDLQIAGSLAQRKNLVAILAQLGLTGAAPPEETAYAAPAAAAAAWPIAAILGLVVVTWGVFCLSYQFQCLQSAERACDDLGVQNVYVSCGGVTTTFEDGEELPSFGLELEGLVCQYSCYPPDGGDDGGLPPPPPPEGFPVPDPNWTETSNPCPPGQEPVPCVSETTTVTSDTSGDIEEITISVESESGWCCA